MGTGLRPAGARPPAAAEPAPEPPTLLRRSLHSACALASRAPPAARKPLLGALVAAATSHHSLVRRAALEVSAMPGKVL